MSFLPKIHYLCQRYPPHRRRLAIFILKFRHDVPYCPAKPQIIILAYTLFYIIPVFTQCPIVPKAGIIKTKSMHQAARYTECIYTKH